MSVRENHPFYKIYQRVVVPDSQYYPEEITDRRDRLVKLYETRMDAGDVFTVNIFSTQHYDFSIGQRLTHVNISLCLNYSLRNDWRFRVPVFNPDRHDAKSKYLCDVQKNGMRRALWETFIPDVITIIVEFCFGEAIPCS